MAGVLKNPTDIAGDISDAASIPGLGRSSGGGNATHSNILAWRIPWRGAWQATVHGVAKSQTRLKWLNTHKNRSLYAFFPDSMLKQKSET